MCLDSRACVYIDKEAILHNIKQIKELTTDSKLMAVIKADGYGHGAKTMADVLSPYCDYYATATVTEAEELRKFGVTKPILVLSYVFSELYEKAIENDITLTVFTMEDAKAISEKAQQMKKTACIHIAVDTGMGRIGFLPNSNSAHIVKEISCLKNICIEGMFTHFATADEADRKFTKLQAKRFLDFKSLVLKEGVDIQICHAANSGAIMQHIDYAFDMVRAGIILYGLYPSDALDRGLLSLKPVMSFVSKVSYVKTLKKGDSVSYGRTFICPKDMKIATIPVGYADGYPRLLSNKGRVIINGQYAPIVGRICMDQFMVDVTDIDDVKTGTKVTLMGLDREAHITADEIANLTDTINYEVVCDISKRVPREVK